MRKLALILMVFAAAFLSCVYYNTFYNAQQGFKRAEKNQRQSAINQAKTNTNRPPRAGPPQEPAVSVNDKNLYKESIDKANKVLTYYPKSKYVDDALWLIGKARYNMGEYISAEKKLSELISSYPNSKFVEPSQYYIGMGYFWMKDYDKALIAFGHITEKKKGAYKDEASYMIAYMEFVQKNYQSSLDEFNKFLKDYKGSDSAASAQFFIGACLDSLKRYQDARQAYMNVLKFSPPFELEFDAKFAAGLAAFKQDSLSTGVKIFSDLAKQPRFFDKSSMLRLRLADGKQLSDSTDAAIAEYEKIVAEFPNTSEAAEANFRLGMIYENLNDFARAKDYYSKASQGTQDITIRNQALTHSAQLSKLENYRARLNRDKSPAPTDSLNAPITDSLGTVITDTAAATKNEMMAKSDTIQKSETRSIPDTLGNPYLNATLPEGDSFQPPPDDFLSQMLHRDSLSRQDSNRGQPMIGSQAGLPMPGLPFDPAARMDSMRQPPPMFPDKSRKTTPAKPDPPIQSAPDTTTIPNDDAAIRFLLAELYDQELGRHDSALTEYLLLAEQYPESPYAPQALLAAAFIHEKQADTSRAKELFNKIVSNYPTSIQARYALTRSDGVQIPMELDVFGLYDRAESLYLEGNNPDSAVKLFSYIEQNFPTSDFAAKAAYARAWILDNTLSNDGDSSAYYAYQNVLNKYPDSPYIYRTKIKLGLIEDTTLFVNKNPALKNEMSDSARIDSLVNTLGSDTNYLATSGLPMAPPVKDTGEFLYPVGLLSKNLKGKVTFKIRIDQFGHVTDYQILGPSGELAIDSAATKALLESRFETSQFTDLSYLNIYYRYDIKFAPPKLDEFYNPYQKREETGP